MIGWKPHFEASLELWCNKTSDVFHGGILVITPSCNLESIINTFIRGEEEFWKIFFSFVFFIFFMTYNTIYIPILHLLCHSVSNVWIFFGLLSNAKIVYFFVCNLLYHNKIHYHWGENLELLICFGIGKDKKYTCEIKQNCWTLFII